MGLLLHMASDVDEHPVSLLKFYASGRSESVPG